MWHIYNLVRAGDLVTAQTFRKVTSISVSGTGSSERVSIKLTLNVEATEFDPIGKPVIWVHLGLVHMQTDPPRSRLLFPSCLHWRMPTILEGMKFNIATQQHICNGYCT